MAERILTGDKITPETELEKRVIGWIKDEVPFVLDHIAHWGERELDLEGELTKEVYVSFGNKGDVITEPLNDEINVEYIKDVLYAWHINSEHEANLWLDVVEDDEIEGSEVTLLCFSSVGFEG